MIDSHTEEQITAALSKALKQARLIADHKGETLHVGCALIELAQAGELKVQLGEGTFELLLGEYFERLDAFCQTHDEVIRVGPYRALIILRGLTSQEHLELASSKLQRVMSPPISVVNHSVLVKTNAGLAMTRAGDLSAEQLCNAAMSALGRAHADERFVAYDPKQVDADADQWELKVELEQALHQGEFFPYFEPVRNTAYGTITAASARMVWHSPKRGALAFEKIAEQAADAGLVRPLTWHFLKSIIGQAAHWDRSIGIIIPVHASIFSDDEIVQELSDALEIYSLSPERITLEVQESVLSESVSREVLATLQRSGTRIRISQLGSGGLPLALLGSKIAEEVTFHPAVLGKQTPPKTKQAVFRLFSASGINMVALGVRDERTAAKYRELGFAALQGPVVSPPQRCDEFTKWLKVKVGAVG